MPSYSTPFSSTMHWPHLDFAAIGVEKQFVGIDLVADAPTGVSVSIGYNQKDLDDRTDAYTMPEDTLPGQIVPIPVAGPSFDVLLEFSPGQFWEWSAAVIYVQDMRGSR